jgi:hypothetical protein
MKNNKEQSWSQRQSSVKWILLFFSSFSYLPTPPVPPAIKLLCVCWFSGGVSSRRYQNQKMGCQKKGGGGRGGNKRHEAGIVNWIWLIRGGVPDAHPVSPSPLTNLSVACLTCLSHSSFTGMEGPFPTGIQIKRIGERKRQECQLFDPRGSPSRRWMRIVSLLILDSICCSLMCLSLSSCVCVYPTPYRPLTSTPLPTASQQHPSSLIYIQRDGQTCRYCVVTDRRHHLFLFFFFGLHRACITETVPFFVTERSWRPDALPPAPQ